MFRDVWVLWIDEDSPDLRAAYTTREAAYEAACVVLADYVREWDEESRERWSNIFTHLRSKEWEKAVEAYNWYTAVNGGPYFNVKELPLQDRGEEPDLGGI